MLGAKTKDQLNILSLSFMVQKTYTVWDVMEANKPNIKISMRQFYSSGKRKLNDDTCTLINFLPFWCCMLNYPKHNFLNF